MCVTCGQGGVSEDGMRGGVVRDFSRVKNYSGSFVCFDKAEHEIWKDKT